MNSSGIQNLTVKVAKDKHELIMACVLNIFYGIPT
jgi:hypothetical protein